ncbi:permease-like cell division protein FtsX [Spirillospora sp. CA-253888]
MMNRTEERLTAALRAAGDTLGPHDVPEPEFAAGRRKTARRGFFAGRSLAAMGGVALLTASVVIGGVVVGRDGGDAARDRDRAASGPVVTRHEGATPMQVSVFLCVENSSNRSCGDAGTTPQQRKGIWRALADSPGVHKIEYESRTEALQRFKERFADFPGKEGNTTVPDAFRLTVAGEANAATARDRARRLPGVDRVVFEGVLVTVRLCGTASTAPACAGKPVTGRQRDALGAALRSVPGVVGVHYETPGKAFARYKADASAWPGIETGARESGFGGTLRVTAKDRPSAEKVLAALRDHRPGVDLVAFGE